MKFYFLFFVLIFCFSACENYCEFNEGDFVSPVLAPHIKAQVVGRTYCGSKDTTRNIYHIRLYDSAVKTNTHLLTDDEPLTRTTLSSSVRLRRYEIQKWNDKK